MTKDIPQDEIPEELLEDMQPNANETALEQLLEEEDAKDQIIYKVHRQVSDTDQRDLEFVMSAAASDYPTLSALQMYLAQTYGGGKYRLYVLVRGKLKKNVAIKIAESRLKTPMQNAGFDPASVKITQVLERLIAQSSEQHKRESEALQNELRALRSQPAPDPLAQMEKLAGLLRTLVPPIAPVQQSNEFSHLLQYMELQERLETRWRERNRDPDNPPSWLDVLNNAPKIIEAMKGLRGVEGLPAGNGASAPALPAPITDPPTPQIAVNSPLQGNTPMLQDDWKRLIPLFQVLNGQAEAGNDPVTYAALIEDNADRVAGPGTLEKLLTLPDLQLRIEAAYPQAAAHREWWAELIELLREEPESGTADGESNTTSSDPVH